VICRHCNADVERDDLPAHLVAEHHLRVCVLCAQRGRATEVETGHCCAVCRVRLDDMLVAIVDLAAQAAAYIVPPSRGGSTGRSVPSSRPPIDVEAVEPELTLVRLQPDDETSDEPILWVLESWVRILMDEQEMGRYGPWSAAAGRNGTSVTPSTAPESDPSTAAVAPRGKTQPDRVFADYDAARDADHAATTAVEHPDPATLTGVVRFLRGQLDYATTEPAFGLEQFADEVRLCWKALLRYDAERDTDEAGAMLACPTTTERGECGYRLLVLDLADRVRCPRCGADRDGATLAHIAISAGDGVWLDPASASTWLGISERTLYRQAREGRIERRGGRYFVRHAPFAG